MRMDFLWGVSSLPLGLWFPSWTIQSFNQFGLLPNQTLAGTGQRRHILEHHFHLSIVTGQNDPEIIAISHPGVT